MRVAIVYDRVNKWGGAESVLLTLHEIFPDAPLYTSVYDKHKAPWADVFPKVVPSFLQRIPILKNYHELLGWLTPFAYESFNFDEFDLVISVTSEAAKGIITKPSTYHLCYCLTPTRYLWSGYKLYLENPPAQLSWIPFYKYISKPFLAYAKAWDNVASQRPDTMIAISTAVQSRIKKYYGRDSQKVFPPVDVEKYKITEVSKMPNRDYFLIVSRLVPYKRVDLAIKAFNEINERLVIIGTGSEERKLKRIARDNIKFKGFVDVDKLPSYYQNARAFILPQEEDFGITAVEAQAAGVPVIAYKSGGAIDTVIEGKTGVYFSKQTSKSLKAAVRKFNTISFNKSEISRNAEKFSKMIFKKKFLELTGR